jgi:hypothetical protein
MRLPARFALTFALTFAMSLAAILTALGTAVISAERASALPGGDPIFIVSDSVLLGARPQIRAAFGNRTVNFHGFGGITIAQAEDIINDYPHDLHESLIVGVGYFYPAGRPAEFDAAIDHFMASVRSLGVKRVLWVTMREVVPGEVSQQSYWEVQGIAPFYPMANAQLRAARSRWPELRVADWAEIAHVPDITWDAVHLTPKGGDLMGELLRESMDGFGRPDDNSVIRLRVPDRGDRPTAAVANITVTQSRSRGFATVYPCDQPQPATSNLNFRPGETVTNLAVTPLSASGEFCVYLSRASHLVVDLQGTLSSPPTSTQLERLLDTRGATAFSPGTQRRVAVGRGTGVFVNVTLVETTARGHLTVRACDDPEPPTSNLNANVGDTIAAAAFVALGPSGDLCVTGTAAGNLLMDRLLSLDRGVLPMPGGPVRLADTRRSRRSDRLDVAVGAAAGPGAFPLITVTADGATTDGFVATVDCRGRTVQVSNLNQTPGRALANLAVAPAAEGTVCLHVDGSTDVIVDQFGWLTPPSGFRAEQARLRDTRLDPP